MKCCNVKPNLVNHALCRPFFFSKKLSKFVMCFVIYLNINQYLNLFPHYSSTTRTEGKLTKWPVSWLSTNWLLATVGQKSLWMISLHLWGGGGKCFVPNAGLMHGSTRPVTTSSHRQLPRQVQPFGPGGGELFEEVLSQGYEGGANQK